jgi:uncharacterized membrane protein
MIEALEATEGVLGQAVRWLRLIVETSGAVWIGVGALYALKDLVLANVRGQTANFTPIRLTFSRYLSLGLEFQLAADILSTAIVPTWQELGKLAATAVIRTGLNYSISREIREYAEKTRGHEAAVVSRAEPRSSELPAQA